MVGCYRAELGHPEGDECPKQQPLPTEKYEITFGKRTTTYQGGKHWNNIPLELKQKAPGV